MLNHKQVILWTSILIFLGRVSLGGGSGRLSYITETPDGAQLGRRDAGYDTVVVLLKFSLSAQLSGPKACSHHIIGGGNWLYGAALWRIPVLSFRNSSLSNPENHLC